MTIKKLLKIWLLLVWPAAIVAGAGVPVAPSLYEKSSPRRDFERPGSRNRKVSFGTVAGVEVRLGVLDDGGPTAEWLAAIKDRMAAEDFEKIKKSRKPLSEAERKWLELAEVVAGEWAARTPRLQIPFGRTKAPARLVILAGNQGGEDPLARPRNERRRPKIIQMDQTRPARRRQTRPQTSARRIKSEVSEMKRRRLQKVKHHKNRRIEHRKKSLSATSQIFLDTNPKLL